MPDMCSTPISEVFPWIHCIRNFTAKTKNIERHSQVSEKVGLSFRLLLCTEPLFMHPDLCFAHSIQ